LPRASGVRQATQLALQARELEQQSVQDGGR